MTAKEYLKGKIIRFKCKFSYSTNELTEFAEAYHQNRVNEISEELISNHIEEYIEKNGYKMHDLQLENDCVTHGQVENIIDWFKTKIQ